MESSHGVKLRAPVPREYGASCVRLILCGGQILRLRGAAQRFAQDDRGGLRLAMRFFGFDKYCSLGYCIV